ncbi:hypothetical protein A2U01_0038360, partial [Trifolium medium]|nr:hypothetical protein [Trifolium medium]
MGSSLFFSNNTSAFEGKEFGRLKLLLRNLVVASLTSNVQLGHSIKRYECELKARNQVYREFNIPFQ